MAEVWDDLKSVRLKLMDPQGIINLSHVANESALPSSPYRQYAYRQDDIGVYLVYDFELAKWSPVDLRISDEVLNLLITEYGAKGAIKRAIPPIMAAVMNERSIAQLSNGVESTTFQSLGDTLSFYKGLQAMYAEEAAEDIKCSTGRMFRTRRPVIGGIPE